MQAATFELEADSRDGERTVGAHLQSALPRRAQQVGTANASIRQDTVYESRHLAEPTLRKITFGVCHSVQLLKC